MHSDFSGISFNMCVWCIFVLSVVQTYYFCNETQSTLRLPVVQRMSYTDAHTNFCFETGNSSLVTHQAHAANCVGKFIADMQQELGYTNMFVWLKGAHNNAAYVSNGGHYPVFWPHAQVMCEDSSKYRKIIAYNNRPVCRQAHKCFTRLASTSRE